MQTITTIGLDIAKSVSTAGLAVLRKSQIAWCRIKTHGSATGRIGGACRGPPRARCARGPALGVDLRDRRHAQ